MICYFLNMMIHGVSQALEVAVTAQEKHMIII